MPFAVFVQPKKRNRAIDPPCLDPLSFGRGQEPTPHLLLRRGRVAVFDTNEHAEAALRRTCKETAGQPWQKQFDFVILECVIALKCRDEETQEC